MLLTPLPLPFLVLTCVCNHLLLTVAHNVLKNPMMVLMVVRMMLMVLMVVGMMLMVLMVVGMMLMVWR